MLKIDQKDLFKILDDFSSLNLLNLLKMIPCKNIKFIKTLTKSKENEKSTLSCFKEPLKRLNKEKSKELNKEKSKELTVNDLQHEINIIKQEISELKKKIEIINMMSTKMDMNLVNGLFFLIKVLLMFSLILNLLLSIKYFFQNGLQKSKLLFLLIIISLLLP